MSTYLIVNLLAFSMPFLLSFDKKVHFYTYWKFLFPSMVFTMVLFIPWDIIFTQKGIWGFNPTHLQGIYLINLPLEEWLFFIVVPYASLFTYEVFNAYVSKDHLQKVAPLISLVIFVLFSFIAILNFEKAYTFLSFILAGVAVFLYQFIFKVQYMGRFYFSYFIVLIPFLIVNGVLTGSFIDEEVVWYNNQHNLETRIFTIPIEDSAYGLLLILMNTGFYEILKVKMGSFQRK